MANGFLLVQSFAPRQSSAVPDVRITLTGEDGTQLTFSTDSEGIAPVQTLTAPDVSLSLDEDNTRQPYSLWNLQAEKEGYQTVRMQGVQVFATQTALVLLELVPQQRLGAPIPLAQTFDIPPHPLYQQSEEVPSVAPVSACEPRVLEAPIIPKTITVHLGKPKESARNVTVSFRSYIANVASSEVYPTWPEQSLRANIHAQISLALNRIFTEWYPSKGYSFDITNSTSYDQYYVHGRNIFTVMEDITDDIFNTYVRRTGTIDPYYTEYCDGKSVTCKGMKQWGTVNRANEGLNALQILRYYYGNNIEIVRTNNIQDIPESYPGSPLRRGDSGSNVRIIQRQLTRIAKDYPFFGTPGTDGVFGPATESVVRAFQKQFNLTQDGVVGRSTWYKISYIYVSVKDLAELTSEGELPTGESNTNGSTYPGTPLRVGSTGTAVERVQYWLSRLAQFDPALTSPVVDGVFGTGTQTAVQDFQRAYGLTVDGVVGPATWQAIVLQYQSLENDLQTSPGGYPGTPLRQGDRGDDVRRLQFYLRMVSSNFSSVPSVTVDGIFGPATTAAVRDFQREFGLTVDGVAGSATWQKLYEVYGDVADDLLSPNQRPGVYPGSPLRQGSSGNAVREAQFYLRLLSVYYSSIPSVNIDGVYGSGTAAAVRAFQTLFGLTADGVIGQTTWTALYNQAQKLRSTDGLFLAYNVLPYPGFELMEGAEGRNVSYIQFLLEYIAYFYSSVQSPNGVDGQFGPDTTASLLSWQRQFGQEETGRVDEFTWNALTATFLSLASGGNQQVTPTDYGVYPGYVMGLGSAGSQVLSLQQAMNGIALRYCVYDFVSENGIYDQDTQQAVREFQQGLGLPVTGVVDEETWRGIFNLLEQEIPTNL